MPKTIYLDYNATAPMRPEVIDAVTASMGLDGNPSSVHAPGRAAREAIETARDQVAALMSAEEGWQVIFTSGGTEANNMSLKGLGRKRLLVSAIEHPSVLNPRFDARLIPVTGEGVVDLVALQTMLAEDDEPALVAIMHANNETGVIQPVAEAAKIAHAQGALLHCDAVQSAGKVALDMEALGADSYAFSAHKLAGPTGVGCLVLREGLKLEPLLRGGGQEGRKRAGTENLSGIVGFGRAAELAMDLSAAKREAALRDHLEAEVIKLAPATRIFGKEAERLPNTSCFALPSLKGSHQVMALDIAGIAVSAGSACSSGKVTASHVLYAMGVEEELTSCALRVSLGWGTTEDDINQFLKAWIKVAEKAV